MNNVAKNCKQARLDKGWSIETLAKNTPYSADTIRRAEVEENENNTKLGVYREIAKALDKPEYEVFLGRTYSELKQQIIEETQREVNTFFEHYKNLSH